MKRKFLEKLLAAERQKSNEGFPLFKDFIIDWLKIKKQTVKETTYSSYSHLITYNLLPRYGERYVNEITRKDIQDILFELTDAGKNRTAAKIKQLLSAIFDVICEDYGIKTPMAKIVLNHYEVKKGKAFTKEEEKTIIDFCKENPHYLGNSSILVLLFTGMRVGELPSLQYDGTFITCESEKTRKGYAKVIRQNSRIAYAEKGTATHRLRATKYAIRDAIKRIFPKRHVHELRYTFITRAKECGCNLEPVMLWDGHKFDKDVASSNVDRGYTKYSDSFYFKEIEKVVYEL